MYAEAGKDFVDLLFSFLMIPAGAIAKQALVSKGTKGEDQTNACCIKNLYESVQNLSPSLLKADKAILLDPKAVSTTYTNDILGIQSPPRPKPPAPPRYFLCSNSGGRYSNLTHSISTECGTVACSSCNGLVNRELKFIDKTPEPAPDPVPTGYVKKSANFVITDDLSVIPVNSTATIVQLWNKLDVQEPTELEDRTVTVGPNEVIGLLRAAMVSTTALNDVFKASSKYSTPVDMDTTGISLQELLIKFLIEDQKYRSKNKVTIWQNRGSINMLKYVLYWKNDYKSVNLVALMISPGK